MKFPNRRSQFVPPIKIMSFESRMLFLFGFAKKPAYLNCRIFPILRNIPILDKDKKVCLLTFSC